jgi:hypothetical protein
MKVFHILCAILACAPLAFEARAIASSEDGRPSVAADNAGRAAGRTAPSRDASAKPEGTRDREPTPARPRTGGGSTGGGSTGGGSTGGGSTGGGSKGRDAAAAVSPRRGSVTPQRGVAQVGVAQAGRNADRLHSLLNAQARGRLTRQPSRPAGSTRAVTRGLDVRGPQGGMPAGQPRLAASISAASPAARLVMTPRTSTIGGPHSQGIGRVGGPAISRTTRSATVDGTQLHHKF